MFKKISLEPSRFALHLAVLVIITWTLLAAGLLTHRSMTRTSLRPRLVDSTFQR
jgi:hypothetical protein